MSNQTHSLRWSPLWIGTAWLLVVVVVYLSLARIPQDIDVPQGDKYAHVLAYAVMAFWFMQIYPAVRTRRAIALGLALLGATLEVLQGQTGYRTFDYADMIANMAGVILGWMAAPPRTPSLFSHIERVITK